MSHLQKGNILLITFMLQKIRNYGVVYFLLLARLLTVFLLQNFSIWNEICLVFILQRMGDLSEKTSEYICKLLAYTLLYYTEVLLNGISLVSRWRDIGELAIKNGECVTNKNVLLFF